MTEQNINFQYNLQQNNQTNYQISSNFQNQLQTENIFANLNNNFNKKAAFFKPKNTFLHKMHSNTFHISQTNSNNELKYKQPPTPNQAPSNIPNTYLKTSSQQKQCIYNEFFGINILQQYNQTDQKSSLYESKKSTSFLSKISLMQSKSGTLTDLQEQINSSKLSNEALKNNFKSNSNPLRAIQFQQNGKQPQNTRINYKGEDKISKYIGLKEKIQSLLTSCNNQQSKNKEQLHQKSMHQGFFLECTPKKNQQNENQDLLKENRKDKKKEERKEETQKNEEKNNFLLKILKELNRNNSKYNKKVVKQNQKEYFESDFLKQKTPLKKVKFGTIQEGIFGINSFYQKAQLRLLFLFWNKFVENDKVLKQVSLKKTLRIKKAIKRLNFVIFLFKKHSLVQICNFVQKKKQIYLKFNLQLSIIAQTIQQKHFILQNYAFHSLFYYFLFQKQGLLNLNQENCNNSSILCDNYELNQSDLDYQTNQIQIQSTICFQNETNSTNQYYPNTKNNNFQGNEGILLSPLIKVDKLRLKTNIFDSEGVLKSNIEQINPKSQQTPLMEYENDISSFVLTQQEQQDSNWKEKYSKNDQMSGLQKNLNNISFSLQCDSLNLEEESRFSNKKEKQSNFYKEKHLKNKQNKKYLNNHIKINNILKSNTKLTHKYISRQFHNINYQSNNNIEFQANNILKLKNLDSKLNNRIIKNQQVLKNYNYIQDQQNQNIYDMFSQQNQRSEYMLPNFFNSIKYERQIQTQNTSNIQIPSNIYDNYSISKEFKLQDVNNYHAILSNQQKNFEM